MLSADEIRNRLAHHRGSETIVRHGMMRSLFMTEGIVEMREMCEAHWLVDLIASWQTQPEVARERFQVWSLRVDAEKRTAVVTMTDGNSKKPRATQEIPYTDFPLDEITIWAEGDPKHELICMLPAER